ncbi:MAG: hypothetical protein A2516_06375 [Alphaproteobacteria bacterium RIFOXYD12_FULL_60_8]|nr:MAG: hypothetical protein A2516_06375 [Alphaproteobacteria bacterium RIFOXYD12_FULL_60_8]
MSDIVWHDKFSVGVEAFDRDHLVLLDLINRLHDAYAADKGPKILEQAFADLMAYTQSHFAGEEALMKRYGYPELEEHRAAHQEMKRDITALQARFAQTGDEALCLELLGYLSIWWHFHILEMDKAYADFFRSKNVG